MNLPDRLQGLSADAKRELLAKLLAREVARARAHPLSFSQQRLWLLDRIDPGTPAYNVPRHLRLHGALDVPALERACSEIVNRHEVLRSRIEMIDGEPAQVVTRSEPLRFEMADLRSLEPRERESALRDLSRREASYRFDLSRDRMLRALLVALGPDEHALLATFHHIAVDGWSIEIFMDELGTLYDAYRAGRELELPELPIQYADFAVWQRERPESPADLAYWRARLDGAPPVLTLPSDRPRPLAPSVAGATATGLLARPLVEKAHALAQSAGATPFMLLLAAFAALLVRYGCGDDIVVGTPAAGRNRPEVEPLIGFFVNTLALRVDSSGDPTFLDLIERVKETTLGAFEHQELPFERVVEAVRPRRIPGANALVQVLFAVQTASRDRSTLGNLGIEKIPVDNGSAKFDMTLSLSDVRDGLEIACEYSTALYDETRIRRLFADYASVLAAATSAPDTPISRLGTDDPAAASAEPAAPLEAPPVAPRSAAVAADVPPALRAVWESILGTAAFGPDEDFFDLGGHSLSAARLLAECERRFGRRLPFGAFYAEPTLRALARSLADVDAEPEGLMWPLRTAGERRPFFFLHGDTAGGGPYCRLIARGLGADQPFYAFAPHGSDGGPVPPTIGAMAEDFLARIAAIQPEGPYSLGGFCHGGVIAYEMAQRLTARGAGVERLVIVNAPAPDDRFPVIRHAFRLLAPLLKLSPRRRQVLELLLHARIVRLRVGLRRGPAAAREELLDLLRSVARHGSGNGESHEDFVDPSLDDAAFEALMRAQRAYRLRPYAGRLALLWAQGEPMLHEDDPTRGWGRYVRQIDIASIPGDHMSSVLVHGEHIGAIIRRKLSADQSAPCHSTPAPPHPEPAPQLVEG